MDRLDADAESIDGLLFEQAAEVLLGGVADGEHWESRIAS
jgi:hypothetical protein